MASGQSRAARSDRKAYRTGDPGRRDDTCLEPRSCRCFCVHCRRSARRERARSQLSIYIGNGGRSGPRRGNSRDAQSAVGSRVTVPRRIFHAANSRHRDRNLSQGLDRGDRATAYDNDGRQHHLCHSELRSPRRQPCLCRQIFPQGRSWQWRHPEHDCRHAKRTDCFRARPPNAPQSRHPKHQIIWRKTF